jgi:hypothetical protein
MMSARPSKGAIWSVHKDTLNTVPQSECEWENVEQEL